MALNPDTHDRLVVVISHELKDKLRQLADKDRRSMSAEIVYILERYLEEQEG